MVRDEVRTEAAALFVPLAPRVPVVTAVTDLPGHSHAETFANVTDMLHKPHAMSAVPKPSPALLRRASAAASWLCLTVIAAAWAIERFAGDRWWLSVPLLYGPQWIWVVPLAIAVVLAVWARSRWLWVGVCGALLMLCQMLGFVISFPGSSSPQAFRIRVLTGNLGGEVQPYRLMELVNAERPQVIALQENSAGGLLTVLERDGWSVWHGRGIAIASEFPIVNTVVLTDEPKWRDEMARCDLQTPAGVVHIFTVHLPTPRHEIDDWLYGGIRMRASMREELAARGRESERVSRETRSVQGPVIIAGDFNLVPMSGIFRDDWSSYHDAHADAGFGTGWSKFTRWWGVRIDHVLFNDAFRARSCHVGADIGSDHRPVIADLEWRGAN